ncbi:hypothetical protein F4778DRAFT_117174 [Xylariomycetidae sp. FL2044]|nr:hypothetical protein F4778DRAFT_117174 [Xylariomycetidae sp. FL2044]
MSALVTEPTASMSQAQISYQQQQHIHHGPLVPTTEYSRISVLEPFHNTTTYTSSLPPPPPEAAERGHQVASSKTEPLDMLEARYKALMWSMAAYQQQKKQWQRSIACTEPPPPQQQYACTLPQPLVAVAPSSSSSAVGTTATTTTTTTLSPWPSSHQHRAPEPVPIAVHHGFSAGGLTPQLPTRRTHGQGDTPMRERQPLKRRASLRDYAQAKRLLGQQQQLLLQQQQDSEAPRAKRPCYRRPESQA